MIPLTAIRGVECGSAKRIYFLVYYHNWDYLTGAFERIQVPGESKSSSDRCRHEWLVRLF
jgi:hypothetical protein